MGSPREGGEQGDTLSVKVAVNVRPLIAQERIEGCQECVRIVPGEPQVQVSDRAAFTFDHVYGSTGTPLGSIFKESILPLVEGLFQGYNATVLAYGQTGSGKTYTMGTAYTVGGNTTGVIPSVMDSIFRKVSDLRDTADVQLRVSFIEIHKEEIRDLLDLASPSMSGTSERSHSLGGLKGVPGKAPIVVRETANGGIQLVGVTETDVRSIEEMAACLEQGSLCRATGSTGMNSQSSRSHAIFTVTVEQRRKWTASDPSVQVDDGTDDYLCAKLHLVDLAGSERAKRTKADGQRLQEGIHINKGLLALGNVISALGDEKKKKENCHVPYRDSKLTRLLQDSLGGNSRTVMIACISPADVNMDETLNTLKYANRARNIQNKPTINRDPTAAEMARLKQQVQLLQAELSCSRATADAEENQMLRRRMLVTERQLLVAEETARTEASKAMSVQTENARLMLQLEAARSGGFPDEIDTGKVSYVEGLLAKIQELEAHVQHVRKGGSFVSGSFASVKDEGASSSFNISSFADEAPLPMPEEIPGEMEEVAKTKELEHTLVQTRLDSELQELNRMLAQKEDDLQRLSATDVKAITLKQHYERKFAELEEEKRNAEKERDRLVTLLQQTAASNDEMSEKTRAQYKTRVEELKDQLEKLKKQQLGQQQYMRMSKRSEEQSKRLQEEILKMKQQKVQLQKKMSHEMEQFNSWKQSHEKQLLQLRKEGRHAAYEMHKLQALHQRQSKVLQRKTEEEANARKQLKELKDMLAAKKPLPRESISSSSGAQSSSSAGGVGAAQAEQQREWLEREVDMVVRVHNIRKALEKAVARRATLGRELEAEKQSFGEAQSKHQQMEAGWGGGSVLFSPMKSKQKITNLQVEMQLTSKTIQEFQQTLLEAEERSKKEVGSNGVGRWQHIRSLPDARNYLKLAFFQATSARCQLKDIEDEIARKTEELEETSEEIRKLKAKLIQSEEALADQRKKDENQRRKRLEVDDALDTAMKIGTKEGLELGMGKFKERREKFPNLDALGEGENGGQAVRKLNLEPSELSITDKDARPSLRAKTERGNSLAEKPGTDFEAEPEEDSGDDPEDPEWTESSKTPARVFKARRPSTADAHNRGARTKQRQLARLGSALNPIVVEERPESSSGSMESLFGNGPMQGKSRVVAWGTPEDCAGTAQSSSSGGCQCSGKCKRCPCGKSGRFCDDQCGCKGSRCLNRESKAKPEEEAELEADPAAQTLAAQMDLTRAMDAIQTSPRSMPAAERDEAHKVFATHGAKLEQAFNKGMSKLQGREGPDGGRRHPLNPLDKNTGTAVNNDNNNVVQDGPRARPATQSSAQTTTTMVGSSAFMNGSVTSRNAATGTAIAATAHAIESSAAAGSLSATTPPVSGVSPRPATPTPRRASLWQGFGASVSARERDHHVGGRGSEQTAKEVAVATALQKFEDAVSSQQQRSFRGTMLTIPQEGVSSGRVLSLELGPAQRVRVASDVDAGLPWHSGSRSVTDVVRPETNLQSEGVVERRASGYNDLKNPSRIVRRTVGDISDLRMASTVRGGNERGEKENSGRHL